MLVGRESECAQIESLLDAARAGRSGALVLAGEPGIGKSALCEFAIQRTSSWTVLTARGVDSESHLAFGGLLDLLHGELAGVDALPARQASALRAALALTEARAVDPFAIGAAVLTLLGAAAERGPVLAVVDDLQWIDAASAQAIVFAARRLGAERIAIILGTRAAAEAPALDTLHLTGLGDAAARALLASIEPRPISPALLRQLLDTARGNPLALMEMPAALTDAQLAGSEALDGPLPAGPTLEQALLHRLRPLPDGTRQALLVGAASDSEALEPILAALSALGQDAATLDAAERVGAITIAGASLRFRHPLLRSAVYQVASGEERRTVHRALADTTTGHRRAWHRAAAVVGHDADVADALEAVASAATGRGANGVAACALERSAELSPSQAEQARRLVEAAGAAQLAGRLDHSERLLERGLARAEDPVLRARAQHLRGRVLLWHGDPVGARELLVAEGERVRDLAPERAALMLAEAVLPFSMTGDVRGALATARAAKLMGAGASPPIGMIVALFHASALLLCGERREALQPLRRLRAAFGEGEAVGGLGDLASTAAHYFVWAEEFDVAAQIFDRVVAAGREASAPALLPWALAGRALLGFRTSRWAAASADATEAISLAEALGQLAVAGFALDCAARIEAACGREIDCREHVTRSQALMERTGALTGRAYAGATLGLLELGVGHADAAAAALEPVGEFTTGGGLLDPTVVQWAPDLVEAYARGGRREAALGALASLERQAEGTGGRWALAVTARCRGLLAAEDGFEPCFREALDRHERLPAPFEQARTELCFGERLRRAGRRTEARAVLHSALKTLEALGATPWAARAEAELRATGATVRKRDRSTADDLTPQETQVALIVAGGATNREAAAALFVTPKTIEFHLGRIYRKLGVRSRTQMAVRLAHVNSVGSAAGP